MFDGNFVAKPDRILETFGGLTPVYSLSWGLKLFGAKKAGESYCSGSEVGSLLNRQFSPDRANTIRPRLPGIVTAGISAVTN